MVFSNLSFRKRGPVEAASQPATPAVEIATAPLASAAEPAAEQPAPAAMTADAVPEPISPEVRLQAEEGAVESCIGKKPWSAPEACLATLCESRIA